jgi:hypothetical protein
VQYHNVAVTAAALHGRVHMPQRCVCGRFAQGPLQSDTRAPHQCHSPAHLNSSLTPCHSSHFVVVHRPARHRMPFLCTPSIV